MGEVKCFSDGRHPKRMAFIQCVGSRDLGCDNGYCSSVCCMYAIKEALVAKEHDPEVEITIFYMDIRTQGKEFDKARERAESIGIKFIRAKVADVTPWENRLQLTFSTLDGQHHFEPYDMVVLAVGLESPRDAKGIAEKAGIELNEYDFCKTTTFDPLATTRDGVIVAGAFQGPKDIPESVTQSSAAAGIAATFNAPIAGVAFAIEVLMSGLQVRMFGNVVIAAVSAAIVSQAFLGDRPAFTVPAYTMHSPLTLLFYLLLGLAAAVVGVMFIRMLAWFEQTFDRWKFPLALKPAVGALLLGLLGFFYLQLPGIGFSDLTEFQLGMPLIENIPHMYGSGFTFIEHALHGSYSFWLLALLVIIKPLATSFTLGSGNSGGVFAPSLFTGAMLGGAMGSLFTAWKPEIAGPSGAGIALQTWPLEQKK